MHDRMKKLLEKKKDIHPLEKKAKMDVLGQLHDEMGDEMKKRMGKVKKVAVASDSKEGLKAGLDQAKEMVNAIGAPSNQDDDQDNDQDQDQDQDQDSDSDSQDAYFEGGNVASDHDQMQEPEEEAEKYGVDDGQDDDDDDSDDVETADSDENEFHGLDMDEIHNKLQKLMKLKEQMESKKK